MEALMTTESSNIIRSSVSISNDSSGQTVSCLLQSSAELCMQDIEWAVGAHSNGSGGYIQLPDFDTLTLFTAQAGTSNGVVNPHAANVLNIYQGKLTAVSSILKIRYPYYLHLSVLVPDVLRIMLELGGLWLQITD